MCVRARDVKRVVTEATMTDRLWVMTNPVLEKCGSCDSPFLLQISVRACVYSCAHTPFTHVLLYVAVDR